MVIKSQLYPSMQNSLYKKKPPNRYLRRKLKPVTVCIAGICDAGTGTPAIVFVADRLITAGIQFEGSQSKIKIMAPYCMAMQSSNEIGFINF